MQFLFDNMTAVFIIGLMLFAMAAVQKRGQQSAVAMTKHYMVKKQAQSLMETLQQDLENMSTASDPDVSNASSPDYDENAPGFFRCQIETGVQDGQTYTKRFVFSTVKDPLGPDTTLTPMTVRYLLAPTGRTAAVNGTPEALYRLDRYEDDGTGWEAAGGSTPILTQFLIELMSNDGTIYTDDDPDNDCSDNDLRTVRVSLLAAVQPVGDQGANGNTNTSRYGITIRPPNLVRFK